MVWMSCSRGDTTRAEVLRRNTVSERLPDGSVAVRTIAAAAGECAADAAHFDFFAAAPSESACHSAADSVVQASLF